MMSVLEEKMNRPAFEMLIKRMAPVSLDDGKLYINIPSTISHDYLKEYLEAVEEAASMFTGDRVKIIVMQEEAPEMETAEPARVAPRVEEKKDVSPLKKTAPFLNPRYTFDNFVVGGNNQLPYNAAYAVAEAPGRAYNPLFIYGGPGLGKTHLMQAIGHYVAATKPNLIVEYNTCDSFVTEFLTCVREKRAYDFKNHYLNLDILLIDDIQFLEGKDRTQYEFFQIFNEFYEKKKQIVVTSDRLPKDIPTLEDRLLSRLNWGLVCDIQPPDFETRLLILRKKVEIDRQYVSEEVLDYIAQAVKTDIRHLEGALTRIIAYANFVNREIDLEIAKKLILEMTPDRGSSIISPEEIIKTVANKFNLEPDDISGKRRKKEVVLPRRVAAYLMRELTDLSLQSIGKQLGRDHTTIIYSCEKLEKEMAEDDGLKKIVESLKEELSR